MNFIDSSSNGIFIKELTNILGHFDEVVVEKDYRPIQGLERLAQDFIEHKSFFVSGITIEPSKGCNLRCDYCYSRDGASVPCNKNLLMNKKTADEIIPLLQKDDSTIKPSKICFFGGEPLLNFDMVKHFIEQLSGLDRYRFSMTTNGTLLDADKAAYLAGKRCSLTISCDGPRHINDRHRKYRNGSGTQGDIIQNLKRFRALSKDVGVRITLTEEFDLVALIDYFESLDITYLTVAPFTIRKGYNTPFDLVKLNQDMSDQLETTVMDRYLTCGENKQHYIHNLFETLKKRQVRNRAPKACDIFTRDLSISSEGDFYPCHRYYGMEKFRIGGIARGLDWGRIREFWQGIIEAHRACETCWIHPFCLWFCPWQLSLDNGTLSPVDPQRPECRLGRRLQELAIWLRYQEDLTKQRETVPPPSQTQ